MVGYPKGKLTAWWFFATPLKHNGVRQLGWWNSQYMGKWNMFQTTNQIMINLYTWENYTICASGWIKVQLANWRVNEPWWIHTVGIDKKWVNYPHLLILWIHKLEGTVPAHPQNHKWPWNMTFFGWFWGAPCLETIPIFPIQSVPLMVRYIPWYPMDMDKSYIIPTKQVHFGVVIPILPFFLLSSNLSQLSKITMFSR